MLLAQRSPAGPQRATAPLLATHGAAVLGRRQLTRDSASHLEEQRRQAQNQAQSKGGRNFCVPSNNVLSSVRRSKVSLAPLQSSSSTSRPVTAASHLPLVSLPLASLSDAAPSVCEDRHCVSTSFKLLTFLFKMTT